MISERTILFLLEGVAMAAAAAWLFYQSWTAALILSPVAIPYCRHRLRGDREKEKRVFLRQQKQMENLLELLMRMNCRVRLLSRKRKNHIPTTGRYMAVRSTGQHPLPCI